MIGLTDGQIDTQKYKCSLNRTQTSVLLVPVPSQVNAEDGVMQSIQQKT